MEARRAPALRDEVEGGGDETGDPALHVDGAAAVEFAVAGLAAEGGERPVGIVSRRHHVGMACKADMRSIHADPRKQVVDLAEGQPPAAETGGFQNALQIVERAAFHRRDRGATDQVARQCDGIGGAVCCTHAAGFSLPMRAPSTHVPAGGETGSGLQQGIWSVVVRPIGAAQEAKLDKRPDANHERQAVEYPSNSIGHENRRSIDIGHVTADARDLSE